MTNLVDEIPQQGITPIKTPRVTQDTVRYQTPDKSQRKPKKKKVRRDYTEYGTEEGMKALVAALKSFPGHKGRPGHRGGSLPEGNGEASSSGKPVTYNDLTEAEVATYSKLLLTHRQAVDNLKVQISRATEAINRNSPAAYRKLAKASESQAAQWDHMAAVSGPSSKTHFGKLAKQERQHAKSFNRMADQVAALWKQKSPETNEARKYMREAAKARRQMRMALVLLDAKKPTYEEARKVTALESRENKK